ncbi:MAG: outer membrane beta-barrel protein [Acidobacteriota bacterium]|nr:outer membrane beta-barrel protein [Acidobacteriota bacterium]
MILASPLPVLAQDNSPAAASASTSSNGSGETKAWWQTITANGFASLSYGYNANQPYDRLNQFRVFDFNDNQPQLDMAQLVIQRTVEKPNQFGFRVNMIAGSGVPEVTAAYGLFRSMQTGVAHHFDIPELYVSYDVPLGKGLRLDVGKMASHLGSEIIGGYDGYNDEFSRGFIFGFGVPFTYTGVKATYAFNSKVTGIVVVVNGWDEFQRYNHGYSWGSQITVTPTKATTLYFNFIHGPERPRDDRDQRSVGEIVGSWRTTPRLNLGFDAVYGHEQNGVSLGHDAIWRGLATYVKYGFTTKFSLAFRGEIFNDSGGTRTGVDQTLQGYTFTPEYDMAAKLSDVASWLKKLDGKFVVRGDIRLDHSNRDVFLTSDPLIFVPDQFTAAINLIYLF